MDPADAGMPGPEEVRFPVLLDLPAPLLRSYPVYTIIAEKLEAMVLLGEANSRMKDFYDVRFRFELDGQTLVKAIRATFGRRETKLPKDVPFALTREFAIAKTPQWDAFIRRNGLSAEPFTAVVDAIRLFLAPPLGCVFAFHNTSPFVKRCSGYRLRRRARWRA